MLALRVPNLLQQSPDSLVLFHGSPFPLAPGKLADMVVVNGDPSKNIADISKVETVFKDGVGLRPRQARRGRARQRRDTVAAQMCGAGGAT